MEKRKRFLSILLALAVLVANCFVLPFAVNANGETETSVTRVQSGHNGPLVTFYLSVTDYAGASTADVGDKHTEYNYWENIKIYTSDTEYKLLKDAYITQKYYNMWARADSLTIQLQDDIYAAAKKIEIPAGTVFPSYQYTNNGSATKGGYITTKDLIFTRPAGAVEGASTDGYDWIRREVADQEETSVTRVQSGHNGPLVTFYLSVTDYAGASTADVGDKHTEYNYWENIKIYTSDTEYKLLKDAYITQKYYNMWARADSLTIQLQDDIYAAAKKIEIPTGTVFPSYQYTNNGSVKKGGYITTKDLIFTRPAGAVEGASTDGYDWTCQEVTDQEEKTTEVRAMHIREASGKLLLFLTEQDYAGKGSTVALGAKINEYNFMDYIEVYKSDSEHKTLKDLYGNEGYYNIWGENGCIALDMEDSWNGATVRKVVIKAGCEFPSYEYTNNGASKKTIYKTATDKVFVTNTSDEFNIDWTVEVVTPEEKETDVRTIHIREASGKLLLFLTEQDYAGKGSTVALGAKINEYNFMDYIEVYKSDSEHKSLRELYGDEGYYNIWGEDGCIALDMEDSWNGVTVKKVVIKAGCEFPSYEYTNNGASKKTIYKTKYDTIFEAIELAIDSISFTKRMVIPSIPTTTDVVKATIMGATQDMRLILYLSEQDYTNATDSEACSIRFNDYNTLDKVFLCKGTDRVALRDVINEDEVYYNLWGKTGSISYGLKPEYKADSFDGVVVAAGCEFPSHEYTSTSTLTKVAYTTGREKNLALSSESYYVNYYDENHRLLYRDEIVCGTLLTLRPIPKKTGYTGKWEGLDYTFMPANDISYQLSYVKNVNEDAETTPEGEDSSGTETPGTDSPGTGDDIGNQMADILVIMMFATGVFALIMKKKNNMGRTKK